VAVDASVVTSRDVTEGSSILIDVSQIKKRFDKAPVLGIPMPALAANGRPRNWYVVPKVSCIQLRKHAEITRHNTENWITKAYLHHSIAGIKNRAISEGPYQVKFAVPCFHVLARTDPLDPFLDTFLFEDSFSPFSGFFKHSSRQEITEPDDGNALPY
jgi:hypothetical protein